MWEQPPLNFMYAVSKVVFADEEDEIDLAADILKLRIYRNFFVMNSEKAFDDKSVDSFQLPTADLTGKISASVRENTEFFINIFKCKRASLRAIEYKNADLSRKQSRECKVREIESGGVLCYEIFIARDLELCLVTLNRQRFWSMYDHLLFNPSVFLFVTLLKLYHKADSLSIRDSEIV